MVIGKLGSYLALGLVGAFLINALVRPQSALGTGAALTETGTGIASIRSSTVGASMTSGVSIVTSAPAQKCRSLLRTRIARAPSATEVSSATQY